MKEVKKAPAKRKTSDRKKAAPAVQQAFSASSKSMTFSEARVRRFIKTLEKHNVLAEFVLAGRVDENQQVKLSPKEINVAKGLLFDKKAHIKDVFAKSMVGPGDIHSTDPKRCPHYGK